MTKPAQSVVGAAVLFVTATDEVRMVSRGRLKLVAALDTFGFDPTGLACLDVGASTGGFTEVLLERGAKKVYAVDVGTGQLHPRLAQDPRVTSMEGRDVRMLTHADLAEAPDAIVADVSFLSLTKALPAALTLAAVGAWLVVLVKPQFEAGPQNVSKSGIVRDERIRLATVDHIAAWLEASGWHPTSPIPSPITGGEGNIEYLLGARRKEHRDHG